MNKWIGLGRLTKDPELKTTPNGISVCTFTIAVNRRFAKEGQQTADFINAVAWRQTAEFICKHFSKGRMISVVGSMQTRTYDKDGQKHYITEVIADEVYFCGDKPKTQENEGTDNVENAGFMPIPTDEELPF